MQTTMSDNPDTGISGSGNRKPLPHILLTRTESDVTMNPTTATQFSPDLPLVAIEPEGLIEVDFPGSSSDDEEDSKKNTMTSSLIQPKISDEEAALKELDQALGDGHDTLRIDSLDIEISTNYTFKRAESGSNSPLMSALKNSFSKVFDVILVLYHIKSVALIYSNEGRGAHKA